MDLEIYKDVEDLVHALAKVICKTAEDAIKDRGRFNFVLSGGSSPKKLYELLASQTYKNKIDWDKTYFFFGDERFVPKNDPQRNSKMAKTVLFDPLKIAESHIFEVDTSGSPEEAAQNYNASIIEHFKDKPAEFDFTLLGLGDNAHTASLFPNTSVLDETEAIVTSVFVAEVDMFRITMSAPLLNQSKHIAFLVFGIDKAEAVFHILEDKAGSVHEYPARLIKSDEKNVQWFMDTAVASKL